MTSFTQPLSQWLPSAVVLNIATVPTSTPSPTSTRSRRERRLKLRDSCDACATSKVKCSKTHPVCTRCSINGSQCVYGVSRKHGKPGRTMKTNTDESPLNKTPKQRPSPDGSEFGKFRIRPEPVLQPQLELETGMNWSPTPTAPDTPDLDFEMMPQATYGEPSGYTFTDELMVTAQCELENHRPAFRDQQSVQLHMRDVLDLPGFTNSNAVNPLPYEFQDSTMDVWSSAYSLPSPQSPKTDQVSSYDTMSGSFSTPTSHCCYPLAYSVLDSLRVISSDTTYSNHELDSMLSIPNLAVRSVLQLLRCSCSSDPHLAMLYSSITVKILHWYQILGDTNRTSSSCATSSPSLRNGFMSPTSSIFSSPMSSPDSKTSTFGLPVQLRRFGLYEFVQEEQLRRQVVLGELMACEQLVNALAGWRGYGRTESAEFLYGVLGTWLKGEVFRISKKVDGGVEEL
ncbi:hypothetical protein P153DRAFT_319561 [Dothidotthia symphoricarpi CBS 119687]|uniref:Zn(2)-C6 fungal-type domain-containing protein n=1 Tax=Dothidotthia symphoricarpi CBS 119687 TaxID=1392245 RepID=A0A6A6ABD6_9PLEO|nr:uncharacterized protein P153DRAFT_319561 [Dothidotthia symphoricarpi CBS 119687]KAF2128188.1 hypothetical protein P153DRAFT_319561 [Dothidotthia symphoricarpi CBS 119687]